MTVPVQVPVSSSIANGVTTVFPYTFKIVSEADLTVTVDDVVIDSGITISGVGIDGGGDVTFITPPANGAKVIRFLNPVLSRVTDYQQFGDWLAPIVNGDFDRIWLTLQSLFQALKRSIKLPVDTLAGQDITEDAADRANKVITFDVDGNVALKSGTELIPEVDQAVTNALAAAADAQAAAGAADSSATDAAASALAASTTPVAAPTHAATSKSTPVDADEFPLIDSAASWTLKKFTWANIKATLKTYFDTLYNLVTVITAAGDPTFADTSNNAASTGWVKGLTKFTKRFVSSQQVITSGGALTLAHGLGVKPEFVELFLVAQSAVDGYVSGAEIAIPPNIIVNGAVSRGVAIVADATNINVRFGSDANAILLMHFTNSSIVGITNTNYRLLAKAYA